jgi:hypothetical protein
LKESAIVARGGSVFAFCNTATVSLRIVEISTMSSAGAHAVLLLDQADGNSP